MRLLMNAPTRSPLRAPTDIRAPRNRRSIEKRLPITIETRSPARRPLMNPLMVLWEPKILSPSMRHRPRSIGVPPPKIAGTELAAYEGKIKMSAEIASLKSMTISKQ